MEVSEKQQIIMDLEERTAKRPYVISKQHNESVDIVARRLECARDEIRCRELMKGAWDDKVVIALDNLRRILERERKGIDKGSVL